MGKKSALLQELTYAKLVIQHAADQFGITMPDRLIDLPEQPIDAGTMTHMFMLFTTAAKSRRDQHPTVEDQPAQRGTTDALVRREQEQPHDDEDPQSEDANVDMLREENGNLRASLTEKSDALAAAVNVLNRITAAAGIDRWTPDGQQIVDKFNKLIAGARKAPACVAALKGHLESALYESHNREDITSVRQNITSALSLLESL